MPDSVTIVEEIDFFHDARYASDPNSFPVEIPNAAETAFSPAPPSRQYRGERDVPIDHLGEHARCSRKEVFPYRYFRIFQTDIDGIASSFFLRG
jgi:hypothetical protein